MLKLAQSFLRGSRTWVLGLLGFSVVAQPSPLFAQAGPPPWERTEVRADCTEFELLRSPFFGDTHVHTSYSADAVINSTPNDPRDAYDFAKGASLPMTSINPTATLQLRRPLDFTMVSDHAETFGETSICLDPTHAGYSSVECTALRDDIGMTFNSPLDSGAFLFLFFPTNTPNTPRFDWCGVDGQLCLDRASAVWVDTQLAAEEHYDRTAACSFTSFVGYEWTGNTDFTNLHRNVVFRNEVVPALPTSYYEAPSAEQLWEL